MIEKPRDVLDRFPIRKSKKQKQAFRDAVQSYAEKLGYSVRMEQGSMNSQNVLIGDPETAEYLVTAHYDTPAALWVPNLMIPCNPVMFVLSQIAISLLILAPAFVLTILSALLWPETMLWYPVMMVSMILCMVLMMAGPANRNNANDNTSGVTTVLEIAASIPENLRSKVCFVLFDLEEMGMVGSSSYRKKHKAASDNQIVLNLDCVGDGDTIVLIPSKKIRQDAEKLARLTALTRKCGKKRVRIRRKGFAFFPSDQMQFPNGVGICALRKNKLCHYAARIHTSRDTVLEYTNVNILRACLISYISGHAVQ